MNATADQNGGNSGGAGAGPAHDRSAGLGRAIVKRLVRSRMAVSTVLLVLVAVVSDLTVLQDFWRNHQITAAAAAEGLVVAIGLFIVRAWRDEAASARWNLTVNVAYSALAQSTRPLRAELLYLVTGEPPSIEGVAVTDPGCDEIRGAVERARVPEGSTTYARLLHLMGQSDWVKFVYPRLLAAKHEGRRVVAQWAPIMLTTDRLGETLGRVARLHESLEDLQRPFQPVHHADDGTVAASQGRQLAAELWDEVLTSTVRIEEDLYRVTARYANDPLWPSNDRSCLSPSGFASLIARDGDLARDEERPPSNEDRMIDLCDRVRAAYLSTYEAARAKRAASAEG